MPLPATGVALVLRRVRSIVPAWAAHIDASDRVASWIAVASMAGPSAALGATIGGDVPARVVVGGLIFVGWLIACGLVLGIRRMLASSLANELAGGGRGWRSRSGYYLYSYSWPDRPRLAARRVFAPRAYLLCSARVLPRCGRGRSWCICAMAGARCSSGRPPKRWRTCWASWVRRSGPGDRPDAKAKRFRARIHA